MIESETPLPDSMSSPVSLEALFQNRGGFKSNRLAGLYFNRLAGFGISSLTRGAGLHGKCSEAGKGEFPALLDPFRDRGEGIVDNCSNGFFADPVSGMAFNNRLDELFFIHDLSSLNRYR